MYSGVGGFERALADVGVICSLSPTAEESQLVQFVLREASKAPIRAAKAVCRTALQWKDCTLWTRAVLTCCATQGLAILPEQSAFSAAKLFNFVAIKHVYVPLPIRSIHILNIAFSGWKTS